MRFRWCSLVVVLALPTVVPSCEMAERRVVDICDTLARCSDYIQTETCDAFVRDALADRRMTDSDIARCGECLGRHDGESFESDPGSGATELEDCHDLLVERDCDKACAGVPFVLRVQTAKEMRDGTCSRFTSVCGPANAAGQCKLDMEASFHLEGLEAQLQVDAAVKACYECIVTPQIDTVGLTDVAVCGSVVDACREPCRKVVAISPLLQTAADVVTVCKNASCFKVNPADEAGIASGAGAGAGGAGGADGTGGAGGAGGMPADDPRTCMAKVFDIISAETPTVPAGGAGAGGQAGEAAGGASAAGGAGGAGETLLSIREKLQDCVSCVAPTPCDSIEATCGTKCHELVKGK